MSFVCSKVVSFILSAALIVSVGVGFRLLARALSSFLHAIKKNNGSNAAIIKFVNFILGD